MSFQNKNIWTPRGSAGCLTDGNLQNDDEPARIVLKRATAHQWFTDASEQEPFCNKKQARLEAAGSSNSGPILMSGISNAILSPWGGNSSSRSVPGTFTGSLFGSDTARTSNLAHRSILAAAGKGKNSSNMGRNYWFEGQFGINASGNLLCRSRPADQDPLRCFHEAGVGKAKVNQESIGSSYNYREENDFLKIGTYTAYNKRDNNIPSPGLLNCNNAMRESAISSPSPPDPIFHKSSTGYNFFPINPTFSKEGGDFTLMGHNYDKRGGASTAAANALSANQPFHKGDGAFISLGLPYGKGNVITGGPSSSKGQKIQNFLSTGSACNRIYEKFMSLGSTFDKAADTSTVVSMMPTTENSSTLPEQQNSKEGKSSTKNSEVLIRADVVVAADQTNPSGGILRGNDHLLPTHPTAHLSIRTAPRPSKVSVRRRPRKKKLSHNFPATVRILTLTGILNGVPVMYVDWSRELKLKGVIRGAGILCGCEYCKFEEVVSGYEFEYHAGCKTKHPNNHIYVENGKTLYAVVLELRATPRHELFEAIQNVTGSPINQKNFNTWKASYEAASRELWLIYGRRINDQ